MDLAARQAGVAQRVEVDDVVGLVDDLGDLPAHLVELGGLQPQLEDGLLQPVAPALQRGCQAGPPRRGPGRGWGACRWRRAAPRARARARQPAGLPCTRPAGSRRRRRGRRWPGPWADGGCGRRRRRPVGPARTGSRSMPLRRRPPTPRARRRLRPAWRRRPAAEWWCKASRRRFPGCAGRCGAARRSGVASWPVRWRAPVGGGHRCRWRRTPGSGAGGRWLSSGVRRAGPGSRRGGRGR